MIHNVLIGIVGRCNPDVLSAEVFAFYFYCSRQHHILIRLVTGGDRHGFSELSVDVHHCRCSRENGSTQTEQRHHAGCHCSRCQCFVFHYCNVYNTIKNDYKNHDLCNSLDKETSSCTFYHQFKQIKESPELTDLTLI